MINDQGPMLEEYPMRRFFISIVIAGLFVPASLAGEKSTSKVVLDLWDAAYLQGARAGHVHTFVEEFERDGQKLLRATVELRLKIKRFDGILELGMDSGDVTTPEGAVIGVFMRQMLGKTKKLEIGGIVK